MTKPQIILLTPGEPSGIGPDIVLDIAQRDLDAILVIIGDLELLKSRAVLLNKVIQFIAVDNINSLPNKKSPDDIYVLPVACTHEIVPGHLNSKNSQYVLDCLDIAEKLCRTNLCSALVTGPVHKGIINAAGLTFTGHTEYLAAPSNSYPVMMLATKQLRVALATTHLPLKEVSNAITQASLIKTIQILNQFLSDNCNITKPRLCICGLNPHAGENGHLGKEEIDTIIPAINECIKQGIDASQPIPADTAFTPQNLKHFDAVLAMYHDQGLPVLKHQGFGDAVNITLGLPFVRTSVDHGTAIELAGTGTARSSSLMSAINMAIELSTKNA